MQKQGILLMVSAMFVSVMVLPEYSSKVPKVAMAIFKSKEDQEFQD